MRSVLILGGTGRTSSKLARLYLLKGYDVTISVRAEHKINDDISAAHIIILDRNNENAVKAELSGKFYDVVFDFSGNLPQQVDWVLSSIKTDRYIYISSFEIYARYKNKACLFEEYLPDFDKTYSKHINIGDQDWYERGKYNSELLLKNKYYFLNYAIARIPFVMSFEGDDYQDKQSSRFLEYISPITKSIPANDKNIGVHQEYTENTDEASFLFFMSETSFKGIVNYASQDSITIQEIIQYVEGKLGEKFFHDAPTETLPATTSPEVTIDSGHSLSNGYIPLKSDAEAWKKVDEYIDYLMKPKQNDGKNIDPNKIKTWLITGGSSGLGRALALRLHKLGYIVATTSRNVSKLDDLPDEIYKIELDVRDIESCRQAISSVIEKMGRIDVLVNNAGILHTSSFEETPDDVIDSVIETNYWGVSNMTKAIIPHMRQNKNGTVINMSSASGFRAKNLGSFYGASKFAVRNLTHNLKFECQRFMRFMCVECGGFNTGIIQRQILIRPQIDEYKNLPPVFPFKKGFKNNINKAIEAIIKTVNKEELPRSLILGGDAYQQFQQALDLFERETKATKQISITTDLAKKDSITKQSVTKPRNKNLKIQNWLITGASEGFGKILALRLHGQGYTVAVTSRDISKLDALPVDIHKIESQLDSMDSCKEAINAAIEKMGSVDVLVNNATSNCWCSFEECDEDIMRKVFYVNYIVPQNMIRALMPHMRENKNGTVINISSVAGIQPRARVSTYSAAKAALEGLTRCLKVECRRFARFMAVELVCMRTRIMINNPVIDTQIPEYQGLGRYTPEINNIPNRKDITSQQIINTVNKEVMPQSLLIGTESHLIALNEINRAKEEFEKNKEISLSVCDKIPTTPK